VTVEVDTVVLIFPLLSVFVSTVIQSVITRAAHSATRRAPCSWARTERVLPVFAAEHLVGEEQRVLPGQLLHRELAGQREAELDVRGVCLGLQLPLEFPLERRYELARGHLRQRNLAFDRFLELRQRGSLAWLLPRLHSRQHELIDLVCQPFAVVHPDKAVLAR